MKNLTIFLPILVLLSCGHKPVSKNETRIDTSFVPYSVIQGNLDPRIVLPLLDWEFKIDSLTAMIVDYENIDEDAEQEMLLIMAPYNTSREHAIFFLDKQNGKWMKGGYIAQGGEFYSDADIPDYSPQAKIFWINPYMNGDCLGGNYLQGYRFINGKIKHVLDVPQHHSGCCDGKNCYSLNLEHMELSDSLVTIYVLFNRCKYVERKGSSQKPNFEKRTSFQLYFDVKEGKYIPVDPKEMDLMEKGEISEWGYPPTDVYIMREYLVQKFGINP